VKEVKEELQQINEQLDF